MRRQVGQIGVLVPLSAAVGTFGVDFVRQAQGASVCAGRPTISADGTDGTQTTVSSPELKNCSGVSYGRDGSLELGFS